jgi:hypothetical protein
MFRAFSVIKFCFYPPQGPYSKGSDKNKRLSYISFVNGVDTTKDAWKKQLSNLDTIVYTKVGINTNVYEQLIMSDYQTVDNIGEEGQNEVLTEEQNSYYYNKYGAIQGNTIAPGTFNMSYLSQSKYHSAVLVINNATTISGIKINNLGQDSENGGDRWLEHSNWVNSPKTTNAPEDKKNNKWSNGCFITTNPQQLQLLNWLNSAGLQAGYQLKTTLTDVSPYSRTY